MKWLSNRLFFYLAACTISFDIFLVFKFGFNFRISQLFLAFGIFFTFAGRGEKPLQIPPGFHYLLLWAVINLVFSLFSAYPLRSLGYNFWLLFNGLSVLAAVQNFATPNHVLSLMRWYIFSFAAVALFGCVQFFLPVFFGIAPPLVMQYWFPMFPRVNGFCYEPSYFATYLLIGWVMVDSLRTQGSTILSRPWLNASFVLMTLAIILSTSRLGLLFMVLWYCQFPLFFGLNLLRGKFHSRLFRKTRSFAVVLCAVIILVGIMGLDALKFLFFGIGFLSESEHSTMERLESFWATLTLFFAHPLWGPGLGGVGPAIATEVYGMGFSLDDKTEGMGVFAEILAGTGVFGFLLFCLYLVQILIRPFMLAGTCSDVQMGACLKSMTWALIVELLILQFNQNILRPYLWLHIAFLSTLYTAATAVQKEAVQTLQMLENPPPGKQFLLGIPVQQGLKQPSVGN